jgi:hypothetical protein
MSRFSRLALVIGGFVLLFGFSGRFNQDVGLAQQAAPSPRPTLTPIPRPTLTPTPGPPTEAPPNTPPPTKKPDKPSESPPTATPTPELQPVLPVAGAEQGKWRFSLLPVGLLLIGLAMWAWRRNVIDEQTG